MFLSTLKNTSYFGVSNVVRNVLSSEVVRTSPRLFQRFKSSKILEEKPKLIKLKELIDYFNSGKIIDSSKVGFSHFHYSTEAHKITAEINNKFNTPEELRELFSKLIGKKVDESFMLFPPFQTDFGKNIHIGKQVFINSGCNFQDQGGIYIGDNVLIGHNAVLATLNHVEDPKYRGDLIPKPIHIKNGVWIGSNVTIVQGITIGENSIIAAGAVVTKDIPPNSFYITQKVFLVFFFFL